MQRTPQLEWRYAEEPEEWDRLTQPSTPVARRHLPRRVVWGGVLVLFVLLSLGLGWLWQTAQAGLAAIERDIDTAVKADAWREHQQTAAVSLVQLEGETAVVEVHMPASAGMPLLQQTRVYRQTQAGWTRTSPSAALWGEARTLQTAHFDFAYHARDEEVVKASAAHLERLYPTLYAAFFPAPLPGKQWIVQVDPNHVPGDFVPWRKRQDPLVVASPAAYLAPSDITPEALLTQSVMLLLLDELEYQVAVYAVAALNPYQPGFDEYAMTSQLAPLGSGIGLWQLWASDLPLAQWREPVVQWVFGATPLAPDQPYVEPGFTPELCAMHQLWTDLPIYLHLPFACDTQQRELTQEWLRRSRTRYPAQLLLTENYITFGDWRFATREVALATAIEYAAATYGPERIPLLLESMNRHTHWQTLVVEVFGVSAEEFETGWAAYLATHYGIDEIH